MHANLFVAWMFNVLYSSALVYLSTWTVVNIAPQAGGAGVAEVTAYLNGCNLPKARAPAMCSNTCYWAQHCMRAGMRAGAKLAVVTVLCVSYVQSFCKLSKSSCGPTLAVLLCAS